MRTNIAITDDQHKFNYLVVYEYLSTGIISNLYYSLIDNVIYLRNNDSFYIHNDNYWTHTESSIKQYDYLPDIYKIGQVKLYFPTYSIEVYKNVTYSLDINTWIAGKKISLGTYIFERLQADAASRMIRYEGEEYYEVMCFDIVDPQSMIYEDYWKDFRRNICGEPNELNNTGSLLYFTLYPIEFYEDYFIKDISYTGGQGAINSIYDDNEYFNLKIYPNIYEPVSEPSIIGIVNFNKVYGDDIDLYLKETYNITDYTMTWELIIGKEDVVYGVIDNDTGIFTKSDIEKYLTSWDIWKEGLFLIGSINIKKDSESIIYLLSNKIPLTKELYSYFVKDNNCIIMNKNTIYNINLDQIDMNILNINTINKIEANMINIDRPADVKSSVIQPVFFKSYSVPDIIIHPSVTENICINLDEYKSKVDTFYIKIEDITFVEIGRISQGILFKIYGKQLPQETSEGIYYIINGDGELVTSGKYKYSI